MEIADRLRAALAGRYELGRELGRGGMSIVFLARDVKHDRGVAIKVLRPELAISLAADRFLREIQIAAQLQHPLIVPLYDSGGAGELLWYAMPFVEGENLRERLKREKQLPLKDALRITRDAAGALGHAHAMGFIHRDIKPENILLSGDHALIADFGIARAITRAAGEGTSSGVAVGTPPYMSPEQASANPVIDARSDIYSLACVLFEMLAGEPPFTGPTPQAVIARHVSERPPSIRVVRPTVPAQLQASIERALAKVPADRHPTAAAFAEALEAGSRAGDSEPARWRVDGLVRVAAAALVLGLVVWAAVRWPGRAPVAEGAEVIAVLPFDVAGRGVEGLAEGMVSLLSANLDAVGAIQTVSPRSVFAAWHRYGDKVDFERGLRLGAELGAQSVLSGSVVVAGDEVRITANLHSVQGRRVAQAQVAGPADSLLTLVDRLAIGLLKDVWRSGAPPQLRLSALSTGSVEALREYLRGEYFLRRSQWDSAAVYFGRAVDQDSTFALAQLRLAEAHAWTGSWASEEDIVPLMAAHRFRNRLPAEDRTLLETRVLDMQGRLEALDSVRTYVSRHPYDPEGWFLLGDVSFHSLRVIPHHPDSVLLAFDRALELAPSMSRALIHPLHLTAIIGDSQVYDRYLHRLAALSPAIDRFALWRAVFWGEPESIPQATARVLAMSPVAMNTAFILALAASAGPRLEFPGTAFREAASRLASSPQERAVLERQRVAVLSSWGRIRETKSPLEFLMSAEPRTAAILIIEGSIAAGVRPPLYDRAVAVLEARAGTDELAALWLAWDDLDGGRWPAAAARLGSLHRSGRQDSTTVSRDLVTATTGWVDLARGDSARGLRDLERGLLGAGYGAANAWPLWYELEMVLAKLPDQQARAVERLRYVLADVQFLAPRALLLGRTAERMGDTALAAGAYRRVIRLLASADPDVKAKFLEPADVALKRLVSPGRP